MPYSSPMPIQINPSLTKKINTSVRIIVINIQDGGQYILLCAKETKMYYIHLTKKMYCILNIYFTLRFRHYFNLKKQLLSEMTSIDKYHINYINLENLFIWI